jgi:sugar phosphate isomerase/epimerase
MIGLSTASFYPLETEKVIEKISKLGFNVIEVFFNTTSELTMEYVLDLKKICDEYGVKVNSIHPFTSFAEPYFFFTDYVRRFNDGCDLYEKYFNLAAVLGAKIFNFHGDLLQRKTTPDEYAEIYYKLYTVAKKHEILFSQENVSRCLSGKSDFLKKLSDILGDNIYFTLDIKQANRAGEDPYSFVEKIGNKIVLVHINDFNEENDCLLPCYGKYDLKKIKKKLDEKEFKGYYIIEVYSQNYKELKEIEQSKNMLEKLFRQAKGN